jgi:cobalamin-dependent methionine synthase I
MESHQNCWNGEGVEYGGLIVPPFYGAGEILTWEALPLLQGMQQELTGRDSDGSGGTAAHRFETLRQKLCADGVLDIRGYYAFFPVFTERDSMFVLDPVDFHSEIAVFNFPPGASGTGKSLVRFFRPEGDIITILCATIGSGYENRGAEFSAGSGEGSVEPAGLLVEIVVQKLISEIRRALGLSREQGACFQPGNPGVPGTDIYPRVCDLLCADDRIGITVSPDFTLSPKHSALRFFIHHQAAHG